MTGRIPDEEQPEDNEIFGGDGWYMFRDTDADDREWEDPSGG